MKNLIIIPGLMVTLFVSGCGGNDKQNSTPQNATSDTVQNAPSVKSESDEEVAGTLVLNKGEKWQANPETMEGIHRMQKLVDEYLANTNANKMNVLAGNLEKEFAGILEKCTMTGEAHQQLHNFLLPLKDKIEGLKKNQDVEKVKEVQSYLAEFEKYFK